jgi:hypothetical protein
LYSFSWFNGSSTVSFLDANGNSLWQFSTPDGYHGTSNMIKYKEIDASTDMIIATSGWNFINYNRFISSSSAPYTVTECKTFRDPSSSSTRELYGFHIIDLNNATSLIYENPWTDIAKINF